MKVVREFEEQAESKGYQSMTNEAGKYAEEYGLQLQLNIMSQSVSPRKRKLYPGIS